MEQDLIFSNKFGEERVVNESVRLCVGSPKGE